MQARYKIQFVSPDVPPIGYVADPRGGPQLQDTFSFVETVKLLKDDTLELHPAHAVVMWAKEFGSCTYEAGEYFGLVAKGVKVTRTQ